MNVSSLGRLLALALVACTTETIIQARSDAGVRRDASSPIDPIADASPDAVSRVSGGSGGIACASTRNASGRTVCVSSAGGSEFRFVAPPSGTTSLGLLVYVHGDGARAYASDGALKALLPWADAHNAIAVAVLAPNACAWWQKPSQVNCSEGAAPDPDTTGVNADALKAVLDTFRARYDVVLDQTFFYGASGGSIFLTQSFLRRYGDAYPGAYALNCGGAKPTLPFTWDAGEASRRGSTKLFFTYGDKDFLKSEIEIAVPFFQATGFPIDTRIVPNAEHCAFDAHGRAVEVFDAYVAP